MPTVSAGSGASLTDIYYEVRGDTASSSGRCTRVYTLATHSQGVFRGATILRFSNQETCHFRESDINTQVSILMIMGEYEFDHL